FTTIVPPNSTALLPQQPFVLDPAMDPFALIRLLLDQANRGEESLAPLRGYTFVRELGRGGMGAVALIQRSPTQEQQTQEPLALKVMRPDLAATPTARDRFEREVEISKALVHPHIVSLRDWGCWRDIYFFTSAYCD